MQDTLITAALGLASVVEVFPCDNATKRPLTDNGFHDATRDVDVVTKWWSDWPYAMIAIATGAKSGIVVLDVDLKPDKGVDGFPALEALRQKEDIPADCMSARTFGGQALLLHLGSDAAHWQFRQHDRQRPRCAGRRRLCNCAAVYRPAQPAICMGPVGTALSGA
jgi:hypothetical protein